VTPTSLEKEINMPSGGEKKSSQPLVEKPSRSNHFPLNYKGKVVT
jgi:hypothetical protein